MIDLTKGSTWQPPKEWVRITTLEAHTGGEPLRIFLGDYPAFSGKTVLEMRRYLKEHLDHIRTATMWEPRGHADMYGCVVTPPEREDSDFGVIFLHNEGYSTMCGHAIIAMTKIAVETGMIPVVEPLTTVKIDAPAGQVTAFARVQNGAVSGVYFHNVPSFVVELDAVVDVPGLGKITYDLAFGGAFYAYVKAVDAGVGLTAADARELIDKGMAIKHAVMANRKIEHPFDADLGFLYGTIFIGDPLDGADSRNVCIFADGEVDRSSTGTGVSGRMAIHHARGDLSIGETMSIESILGSRMIGSVVKTVSFGGYDAVIPQVEGNAHICGRNEILIDPEDPLKYGFLIR